MLPIYAMNTAHKEFTFRCSKVVREALHLSKNGYIKKNYVKYQQRYFFFKREKNNIIKNEIDDILKKEKNDAIYMNKQGEKEKYYYQDRNNIKFTNKKGKFKRLFIFIAFQSIPIIGLMYLFKYVEDVKLSELTTYSFESSEDIVNETIKLINGNSKCFCAYVKNNEIHTFYIDPLGPEDCEINYERKSKGDDQLVEDKEVSCLNEHSEGSETHDGRGNDGTSQHEIKLAGEAASSEVKKSIKDLLYAINEPLMQKVMSVKASNSELPLNYLYFCVSKNTDIHEFLKNNKEKNNISLLYSDEKKNVYATLTGNASIIENENVKNVVWTDKWSYFISDNYKENYILIKFTPSSISLKIIGIKNKHWQSNIVKRIITDHKIAWVKI
ncbi:conserved Plasmodium protein, unknown function [Plasmodium malariae]|uniref:Uncharacterized protein n=1 Tax=Plasmodium malariae TaxID=5858 RepID=A0A1C3L3I5_PLAMA|nr:conserved Plasmodium protein, unknown function [Plasmodium malariae]